MARVYFFCIILITAFSSCGKDSSPGSVSSPGDHARPSSVKFSAKKRYREKAGYGNIKSGLNRRISGKKDRTQNRVFLPDPATAPKNRMLEYSVSLQIKSTNLVVSRATLLSIIPKYGFLLNSSCYFNSRRPYHSLTCRIRTENLYKALIELTSTGTLLSERIRVTDHTENRFISSIRARRADLRLLRYRRQGITAKRENYIQSSEDSKDDSTIRKWRIRDKVKWARVSIYLRGPEKPTAVSVPSLRDKLVETVNWILELLFNLIPVLPVLFILLVIWIKRKKIRGVFSGKKK